MVKIYKILRITSGCRHAWVKTDIGVIRKPLNNIKIWDSEVERKKMAERLVKKRMAQKATEADKILENAKKTFKRNPDKAFLCIQIKRFFVAIKRFFVSR